MTRLLHILLAFGLILCALSGGAAMAQQGSNATPAMLVADQVFVENQNLLVAQGNVEAFYGDTTLSASRITYDRSTDRLEIVGPIRITDASGMILTATRAELDRALENGILTGARLVMDQQLQLAALQARRAEGRYTQLSKVAVTSCQVCGENQLPLWQIRARRVVHDQMERQLYFDEAQFRILDVPVFYVPRLRLPDPTLKRARGFLIPSIHSSTLLGLGLRVPYFIPIGDHQDVTLTPYLSNKTRSLEFRYRRAFRNGDLQVSGAVSGDSLKPGAARGYLFARGDFNLPRDFTLSFDVKTTSDASYLSDYSITDVDRLDSSLTATRVRRDELIQAGLVHYESLRESEENDTQPTIIGFGRIERRGVPARIGGEWRLSGEMHGHYRYSSIDIDSGDDDQITDGRDVARLALDASWRKRWTLPMGLRAGAAGYLWMDAIRTYDDAAIDMALSQTTPAASLELRWPFQRQGIGGGRDLIEPIVQYGWVGGTRLGNANDESLRVEFDEANLLTLSRFPAADRREHGQTLAAGLRWMHQAPEGWSSALTLGRIWRDDEDGDFTRSSGLVGETSDWLVAGRFAHENGLSLTARGLMDGRARFSKAEARADWSNARMQLGASYLLLVPDDGEDRDTAQSEWSFDGEYRFSRHWTGSTEWRYDLAGQDLDRVGLGLQYRNECIQVDFGVSRRYASSSNLTPSTDFDLTVALHGFGTSGSDMEYRRTCSN